MKKPRVLINGFGRIGRAITRINLDHDKFELVAVNDINPDAKNMAYLLKYDSTYGQLARTIEHEPGRLFIDGQVVELTHKENIKDLDLTGIDIVIEATGIKSNLQEIEKMAYLNLATKYVITNVDSPTAKNIIFGVNESELLAHKGNIFSASICDAVAMGPVYNIIKKEYGVISGYLVTLHPWLSYQNLLDGSAASWSQPGDVDSHFALGRAAPQNLIPKSTSAVNALAHVIPEVPEKIGSFSFRVPTPIVSGAVLTLLLNKDITVENLIATFKNIQASQRNNIIALTSEPLISADYIKNDFSAIIDTRWIRVKNMNHVELIYWYDNEWGYSSRVVDLIIRLWENT